MAWACQTIFDKIGICMSHDALWYQFGVMLPCGIYLSTLVLSAAAEHLNNVFLPV
jgi:hypothetical protein